MIRIAISVEGHTENEFCNQVLQHYFRRFNIQIYPIIISTKRLHSGKKFKGGSVNVNRIENEIKKLLPSFDYVSTFYDLYGFDISDELTADDLEHIIKQMFPNSNKLIPYIQQYEFETLLFSDSSYYNDFFSSSAKSEIDAIIKSCNGVENINNSKETAPSKRLEAVFEKFDDNYDKVFHGPSIAGDIGIEKIMENCPRFKNWVETLQSLRKS